MENLMSVNQGNVTPNNGPNGQNPAVEAEDKPPVWLIITVVVLGLAIIGMLVVIVMKVLIGDKKPEETVGTNAPAVSVEDGNNHRVSGSITQTQAGKYLDNIKLERPKGSDLVSTHVSGRYISMTFRLEAGGDVILILDRTDGSVDTISIPVDD
jgi:hypothetical protein